MKAYVSLTRAFIKSFLRDRAGLFWSFFFPIFFIIIFGSLFGSSGQKESGKQFTIGLVIEDKSPAVAWVPSVFERAFKLRRGALEVEKGALQSGKSSAIVVIPPDFSAKVVAGEVVKVPVFTDPTQRITGPIVNGIIRNMLAGIEQGMRRQSTLVEMKSESLPPNPEEKGDVRQIDFLIPGILAMTIMQLGLFTAIPIIIMREKGILKRFRATPLRRHVLVSSQVTQRLAIAFIQTMVILLLGTGMYGFHVSGSWPALIGIIVLGVLSFICIGAVLASIAKTPESGVSIVQLVNFPMMFLSGIFFPLSIMGGTFRTISNFLPATYLADAIRHVTMAAPSTYSMTTDVFVLLGWLVGGLFVAAKVFRWE